ncbi:DUF349 domain-containing protein [Homoserinibacter sp. YIM 151385]|uniref:DUF349 domain-containing protein n=1 Tax=Homoserinibacter sp. YIM 151385 TaxID=2985506 RepID=UPI0022F0DE15|nr:DUF349 domain-containing protein [Homoserinibacter sp. YIM 151385]WBU38674.1 DUF349 domain-containing protein [Homoserinibacter sp. YIM 151385]
MATDDKTPWGRVDDDGTVYVRDGDAERAVGQYPDATPEEALAYYERKYVELEGQVHLLEQRIIKGAPAADVAKAAAHLRSAVESANAVGDLASLRERLEKLSGSLGELTEKQSAESRAALEAAVAEREAIVVEAERLAAQDPGSIQWKQTTAALDALFARWQAHQQDGPRLPKHEGNELWKRFRAARSSLDGHRKAFFAELDATHKEARARKQALAERAEALIPKGTDGIPDYRRLLDDWKRAGRAGKKVDDALWARFKAAGDALYQAKAEVDARDDEEFRGNLVEKEALLVEAEQLLGVKDRQKAKDQLIGIQRRWDAVGKVPRNAIRGVEDRLRKVEDHVRRLDQEHWEKSDPEKQARSTGLASQLTSAIAKLEAELEAARASGDTRKIKDAEEALAARRVWLDALG